MSQRSDLDAVLEVAAAEAGSNNWEKGRRLERLIREAFVSAPRLGFDQVWLWQDYPGRRGRPDIGVDLVASDATGKLTAIQCKFWKDVDSHSARRQQWKNYMPKIDQFLRACGTTEFDAGIFVYTTRDLPEWGLNNIREASTPCEAMGRGELSALDLDWWALAEASRAARRPRSSGAGASSTGRVPARRNRQRHRSLARYAAMAVSLWLLIAAVSDGVVVPAVFFGAITAYFAAAMINDFWDARTFEATQSARLSFSESSLLPPPPLPPPQRQASSHHGQSLSQATDNWSRHSTRQDKDNSAPRSGGSGKGCLMAVGGIAAVPIVIALIVGLVGRFLDYDSSVLRPTATVVDGPSQDEEMLPTLAGEMANDVDRAPQDETQTASTAVRQAPEGAVPLTPADMDDQARALLMDALAVADEIYALVRSGGVNCFGNLQCSTDFMVNSQFFQDYRRNIDFGVWRQPNDIPAPGAVSVQVVAYDDGNDGDTNKAHNGIPGDPDTGQWIRLMTQSESGSTFCVIKVMQADDPQYEGTGYMAIHPIDSNRLSTAAHCGGARNWDAPWELTNAACVHGPNGPSITPVNLDSLPGVNLPATGCWTQPTLGDPIAYPSP